MPFVHLSYKVLTKTLVTQKYLDQELPRLAFNREKERDDLLKPQILTKHIWPIQNSFHSFLFPFSLTDSQFPLSSLHVGTERENQNIPLGCPTSAKKERGQGWSPIFYSNRERKVERIFWFTSISVEAEGNRVREEGKSEEALCSWCDSTLRSWGRKEHSISIILAMNREWKKGGNC